jgi:hypothetical protein
VARRFRSKHRPRSPPELAHAFERDAVTTRYPLFRAAGVCTLFRAACWIIGPMRRARYSANLRATGELVLGAFVLIGEHVFLMYLPALLLVI